MHLESLTINRIMKAATHSRFNPNFSRTLKPTGHGAVRLLKEKQTQRTREARLATEVSQSMGGQSVSYGKSLFAGWAGVVSCDEKETTTTSMEARVRVRVHRRHEDRHLYPPAPPPPRPTTGDDTGAFLSSPMTTINRRLKFHARKSPQRIPLNPF